MAAARRPRSHWRRLTYRLRDGVEQRHLLLEKPSALPRHDAGHHLRAVLHHLPGMEGSSRAGNALHEHAGVAVHEDAHAAPRAAATAFSAASRRFSAGMIFRPDLRRISFPCSTLVPSSRTTSGTRKSSSFAAATTSSAITSLRMIPPKMLTRIAFTLGSARINLKATATFSFEAPPPTSRKLAGLPPTSLIVSIVAIASPAPFTRHPMFPSRWM